MAVKITLNGTYPFPVKAILHDEKGKEESIEFEAIFKYESKSKSKNNKGGEILDHVLVDIKGLEIEDDGNLLTGDDLLEEVKFSTPLSNAILDAWGMSVRQGKNRSRLNS